VFSAIWSALLGLALVMLLDPVRLGIILLLSRAVDRRVDGSAVR
jgi:hypothetical protein